MINLFYLRDFFNKSHQKMSSLYREQTKERFDWGKVENELREGNEVHLRPATPEETSWALEKLGQMIIDEEK